MITQGELKKYLYYDPETGIFTRLKTVAGNAKKGDIAGFKQGNNCGKTYLAVTLNMKLYLLHRLAWLYVHGEFPKDQIDHINGNGVDNRISNLRDANPSINHMNMRKPSTNTSGIVGVYWAKREGKWNAKIHINYKGLSLGYFDNIFDAACVRKSAEIKYGFHKNHGSERSL